MDKRVCEICGDELILVRDIYRLYKSYWICSGCGSQEVYENGNKP